MKRIENRSEPESMYTENAGYTSNAADTGNSENTKTAANTGNKEKKENTADTGCMENKENVRHQSGISICEKRDPSEAAEGGESENRMQADEKAEAGDPGHESSDVDKSTASRKAVWYVKKIYTIVVEFITKIMRTNIAANSGQVSYMLILAFFPFFIFLFSFLKYTPVTEDLLIQISDSLFPKSFQGFIHNMINSLYQSTGVPTISITVIMLIWLASRATLAMIVGLDNVYEVRNPRKYVKVRLLSMIYTVFFAGIIIFSLTALVFGNSLINIVIEKYPPSKQVMELIRYFKGYVSYIMLFIVFSLMYRYMPNHYYNNDENGSQPWISTQKHRPEDKIYWVTWRGQIPGTIVAVAGWGIFSYIYSIYVSKYSMYSKFYGTMTTIALLMVWLYFCMYIFFVGGLLNSQLKKNKDIRMLRKMMSSKNTNTDKKAKENMPKKNAGPQKNH